MSQSFQWMSFNEVQTKDQWFEKTFSFAQLECEVATTIGGPRSRYDENQDVILVSAREKLLRCVVVDGAGSTSAGQRAAVLCAQVARDLSLSLEQVYLEADDQICRETRVDGKFDPKTSGYGAVVGVDLSLVDHSARIVFWGDCRALLLRAKALVAEGTTLPQNVLYDRVVAGTSTLEEYYACDEPSHLSGGLGLGDSPKIRPPLVQSCQLEAGDVLVLASDGIWDQVSDYEALCLWKESRTNVKKFSQQVRELAFTRNNASKPFELLVAEGRLTRYCPDAADNASLVVLCLS